MVLCAKIILPIQSEGGFCMNITIKNVSSSEYIALTAQLGQEIWHEHYDSLIGPDQVNYMLEHFQSVPAITDQLSHGTTYLLAYGDEEPAGYCAFKPEDEKMFLSKIYVRSAFRKRGIASALFDQVQKASGGKTCIYLTVNKHNSGSIAVYKKLGFSVADEVVTDIGSGYVMDDFIMEKAL